MTHTVGNVPEGASRTIQATVHHFDSHSGDGSVITDRGEVISFRAAAWQSGPLLTLRSGQRLRVQVEEVDTSLHVTAMTLVTFAP